MAYRRIEYRTYRAALKRAYTGDRSMKPTYNEVYQANVAFHGVALWIWTVDQSPKTKQAIDVLSNLFQRELTDAKTREKEALNGH